MTLQELIQQWRKPVTEHGSFDIGLNAGLTEAADELEDWLKRHKGETI